jgi:hypothetical protein
MGLMPRARGRVELDQSELIRKVGERERRHPIGGRSGDGVTDAKRPIGDRKFAVDAQVYETGR